MSDERDVETTIYRGAENVPIDTSVDTPIPGLEEAEEEPTISQVETALSKITSIPEDNQSLLSVEALEELRIQALVNGESLPATFLSKAAPHLHTTNGVVDFATTVCLAVARGEIKPGQSGELRKWAELMYTCIVANGPQNQQNVQVNYVEQLIQLAGGEQAMQPEVLEVRDAILHPPIIPRKKAQGE